MKSDARLFGDRGEQLAADFLKKNKYRILARNLTVGRREIDILAECREALVFVEVKTRTYSERTQQRFGRACLSVDADKRRNLLAAARAYIAKHPTKKPLRFDVIEVYFGEMPDTPPDIHHMPDAFRA